VKKALNILKSILVWLTVVLAVLMMIFTVISVSLFDKNDRTLFGYKIYIVNSNSMAATDFDAGALIFVKEVNPADLRPGDIISFISQNSDNFGKTVTHKIRRITTDVNGEPGFVTYGTTTDDDDEAIVTYPYILGKYSHHIPAIGFFFNFLKTTPGYFVCNFVPFMILIIYQGINTIRLFGRYKREQMEDMKAEREAIESQRAENLRMMEEIKSLKAQLDSQASQNGTEKKQEAEEVNKNE